ncbi:class I SAM-dependent methyltransferase [Ruegeria atlantica]|uniref:class I SAM-dependent methyltransferase n=1 Tax=Ruegeria atlantica TaxID=81569 RepID=UPI00147D6BBA|nr:SAM-dependent methyltransferase [Ruegeria atlantica]
MFYVPQSAFPELSRTALGVCAFCALVNRNPTYRRVFYDPFAEQLFRNGSTEGPEVLDQATDWDAVLKFADDRSVARRLVASVLWRKTFMQSRALTAIKNGARQIVVLGAGLDTLGLRLSNSHSHIPVFEVDRPETIEAKRSLVSSNFGVPPNVRYTAVDFSRETTLDKLQSLGYDHELGTVFIAEVSLEYVAPPEVADVYAMIRSNGAMETRFLTTYASTAAASQAQKEVDSIGNAVAGVGEPFRFNISPSEVSAYASEQGFSVLEHIFGRRGTEKYLSGLGLGPETMDFPMDSLDASSFSLVQLRPT